MYSEMYYIVRYIVYGKIYTVYSIIYSVCVVLRTCSLPCLNLGVECDHILISRSNRIIGEFGECI